MRLGHVQLVLCVFKSFISDLPYRSNQFQDKSRKYYLYRFPWTPSYKIQVAPFIVVFVFYFNYFPYIISLSVGDIKSI